MTAPAIAEKATPPQNREKKARLIARAAWRRGLTFEHILAMPYSGEERSRTRFARMAYRESVDPADHERNPPSGPESRTWRLVEEKLAEMTARARAGLPYLERDLLDGRQAWLDPENGDPWDHWAEEDTWPTPANQGMSSGSSSASPPAPRGLSESSPPTACALDAGTPTTAHGDGPAPRSSCPSTSTTVPEPSGESSTAAATALPTLPRGWAELAALPPLDYGSCINHPGRRPVVISPDGGRCGDCPPRPSEIHVKFVPTRDQLAQDLVPFEGYRNGWGMSLNWAPKTHLPAPLRCYCGRCPLEGG